MFKHILIPTDGSRLALKGIKAGVKLARALGARVTGLYVVAPYAPPPWEGILRAARSGKCDAVAIASHGRGGLGGLILGSETQRVLAHSKIPVLVVR
jgi:nucleotide-binding universal stress UspA family protein